MYSSTIIEYPIYTQGTLVLESTLRVSSIAFIEVLAPCNSVLLFPVSCASEKIISHDDICHTYCTIVPTGTTGGAATGVLTDAGSFGSDGEYANLMESLMQKDEAIKALEAKLAQAVRQASN